MSSSVVGAAAVVDTSNILYPTGDILLCLKKVKSKNTDPAIVLFTCVRKLKFSDTQLQIYDRRDSASVQKFKFAATLSQNGFFLVPNFWTKIVQQEENFATIDFLTVKNLLFLDLCYDFTKYSNGRLYKRQSTVESIHIPHYIGLNVRTVVWNQTSINSTWF